MQFELTATATTTSWQPGILETRSYQYGLDNFSSLQIPHVSFNVLAATYNPFSANDTKTGRDALFCIDLGLQALCGSVTKDEWHYRVQSKPFIWSLAKTDHADWISIFSSSELGQVK